MTAKPAFQPCAIIPVYDHATTIASVTASVRAHDLPVLLVDDGSGPDCAEALASLARNTDQVQLLSQTPNAGKGAAVLAGARMALARGFSHALQIDADGQHSPASIAGALERAARHPTALIAGVPEFDDSIPGARLYGRYVTNMFVWLNTWSLTIRDALCGFRVYPLAETVALANREPLRERMDFDIDIAVRLVWDNVPVVSVPVAVHYPADGISHFDFRRDNLQIARVHATLFCGMLLRAPLLAWQRLSRLRIHA